MFRRVRSCLKKWRIAWLLQISDNTWFSAIKNQ